MALKGGSKEDWAQMQTRTFTKWVDQKLKMKGSSITDISTELSDGIKLHQLMEVLSQRNPGKYNTKPRIQVQKMENLQKILGFIQNEEGIRLVNIGAGDIFEGNLNLIRGLIWALILHYQIGKGHITDQNDGSAGTSRPKAGGLSGKQLLLQYINDKIPQKNIKNFTTDWNDGTAVAALVDAHAPGLCSNADSMDPNNALQNASEAMKLAEDWLGIPQILAPHDLIDPSIDELSMMTYLSQYQQAVVKEGAPGVAARPATPGPQLQQQEPIIEPIEVTEEMPLESTIDETQGQQTDITKVTVYGSLIDELPLRVGQEALLFVDCTKSGQASLSAIVTLTSTGTSENIKLQSSSNNPNIMTGTYSPTKAGNYSLDVKYDGKELSNSPYRINVCEQQVQYQLMEVTGTGTMVGKQVFLTIDCSRSGITGTLELPSNEDETLVFSSLSGTDQLTISANHSPSSNEIHQITLRCKGKTMCEEPYTVDAVAKIKSVKDDFVSGNDGIKHPTKIIIDCSESSVTPVSAKVKYPSGKLDGVVFEVVDDNPSRFIAYYEANSAGKQFIELEVQFDDRPVPGSPVIVPVTDISKVKVSGSGITGDGARVGKPANIIVDCSESGVAPVTAKVKDPSGNVDEVRLLPKPGSSNLFEGSYQPEESGEFKVGIDFDGRSLPNFPIKVLIKDASKVKVSGPGIDGKGANVGKPAEIIVDCSESGVAPISAKVTTPTGDTKDVDFKPKAPGSNIYTGSYTPNGIGGHEVEVNFDNEPVENSPFTANIKDISKVKVSGPGVTGKGVKPGNPAKVIVDCSESGVAQLCGKVKSPSGKVDEVVFEAVDDNPNVFAGFYEPDNAGQYELAVEFDDKPLPGSPVIVPVTNISKVKVSGSGITGDGARVGKPANIIVDCSESGVAPVTAKVKDPSGNVDEVRLLPKPGSSNVFEGSYFPKEPGTFEAEVDFNEEPVPDSPYKVGIGKPENVRISGDGLDKAFVGEDNIIDVFTGDAGPGEVSVKFDGPPRAAPVVERIEKVDDDHYKVHFSPDSDGQYELTVYYDDVQCMVENSINISVVDLNNVHVTGPNTKLLTDKKIFFHVHDQSTMFKSEDFTVSVVDCCGVSIPFEIVDINEEVFQVCFTPVTSGKHKIGISLCGRDLNESPYIVMVEDVLTCSGDGLLKAIVNQKESFDIEIPEGYKLDEVSVAITGPENVELSQVEEDNVVKITYTTSAEGVYEICIKAREQEVKYSVESHSTTPTSPPSPAPFQPITRRSHEVKRRYSIIPLLHISAVIILAGIADQSIAAAAFY